MKKQRRVSRSPLSTFTTRPARRQRARRRLRAEQLEDRRMLAGMHNLGMPLDTNTDFNITAIDALVVINELNATYASAEGEREAFRPDVDGNGEVTPLDALLIINHLNAEGEGTATYIISAVPFDQLLERPVSISGSTLTTLNQTTWGNIAVNDQIILSDAIDNQGNIANGQYTVTGVNGGSLTLNQAPNLVSFFGTVQVGRIISQIGTDTDFTLGVVAEDLTADGPFAVYTDITFDSSLASVTGFDTTGVPDPESPTDNFKFNGFVNGKSGDFTTLPGLIDEAGSFASAGSGLGRGTHLAFTVDMRTGGTTGTLDLALSAAGIILGEDPAGENFPSGLPAHDVLVNGSNVPVCQMIRTTNLPNDPCVGMAMYNPASLLITSDITALPDSGVVNEDAGPIFINVLANDSITIGSGPTITNPIPNTSANGGTVQQSGNNGFSYTPAANFAGTDTFSYTITNGISTASGDVTVTVNPVNDSPLISGPAAPSIDEDTGFTLGGFSIVDIDSTNITVDLSANGTLSQTSFSGTPSQVTSLLNQVTYTPLADSTAADTITISAGDGNLADVHTVNITIRPINDGPINTIPGPQMLFNTDTLAFANDEFSVADVDASTLEVRLEVTQGTVSINGAGLTVQGNNSNSLTVTGSIFNLNTALNTLVYDPIDTFFGTDTLTMTTSDLGATGAGGTLTDTDAVTLVVTPAHIPFAITDAFSANEGTAAFTLTPNPLDNDLRDVGATLSVTDVSPVSAQGTLTFANGDFTYTPPLDPDFFGTETFTYTIEQDIVPSSTGDTSDTGTIVIEIQPINDGPVNSLGGSPIGASPTVTVTEENVLSFSGANELSIQDVDAGAEDVTVTLTVNNGALSVSDTTGVQGNGGSQLTINGPVSQINNVLGGLSYRPQDDFFGDDPLVINTNDNGHTGASALADIDTVNIEVVGVNDAPELLVPGDQTFFTNFDNHLSSEPQALQIVDVDAGANDVQVDLTIAEGTLTLGSTLGVTITQDPAGNNGIRLTGSVSNINSALDSGLIYRSTTAATSRPLSVFVDDLGNTGGGSPLTAAATVQVEVLENSPPTAVDDAVSTDEDTPLSGDVLAANPSLADNDIQDDTLTVTELNGVSGDVGNPITLASGALLTLNANGTFTYDPNGRFEPLPANLCSIESFTYTITDGKQGFDSATVSIDVCGVNDAPVAGDDRFVALPGVTTTPPSGALGNDMDVEGEVLTVTGVNGDPGNVGLETELASGALVTVTANGSLAYTPRAGTSAVSDSFEYTVSDAAGASTQATVVIDLPRSGVQLREDEANPARMNLVIADLESGGKNDNLTVRFENGDVVISDTANLIIDQTKTPPAVSDVVRIPLGDITGEDIVIDLLGGDDVLMIDFSGLPNGGLDRSLSIHGGDGSDKLVFDGATPMGSGELSADGNDIEEILINGPITAENAAVTLTARRNLEVNADINTGAGGEVRLTATEHDIFGNCSLIQAGSADVDLISGTGIAAVRVQTTGDVIMDGAAGGVVGCTGEIAVSAATLEVNAAASVGTAEFQGGVVTVVEPFRTSVDGVSGTVGGLGIFLANDRALTDSVVLTGTAPLGVRDIRVVGGGASPEGEGSPTQPPVPEGEWSSRGKSAVAITPRWSQQRNLDASTTSRHRKPAASFTAVGSDSNSKSGVAATPLERGRVGRNTSTITADYKRQSSADESQDLESVLGEIAADVLNNRSPSTSLEQFLAGL